METAALEPPKTAESKPIVEDPKLLFFKFRDSEPYRNAFELFFKGKNISTEVTEDEKRETFEGTEAAKYVFLSYVRDNISFRYKSNLYPPETQKAIQAYLDIKTEYKKRDQFMDQNYVIELDRKTSFLHSNAGKALATVGIAPSPLLGKGLASVIAIEKGLDTYSQAAESNLSRVRRMGGL